MSRSRSHLSLASANSWEVVELGASGPRSAAAGEFETHPAELHFDEKLLTVSVHYGVSTAELITVTKDWRGYYQDKPDKVKLLALLFEPESLQ